MVDEFTPVQSIHDYGFPEIVGDMGMGDDFYDLRIVWRGSLQECAL